MQTEIWNGKPVAQQIQREIIEKIQGFNQYGIEPHLVIVRVGDRPDDLSYEKSVLKKCGQVGIQVETKAFSADVSTEQLYNAVRAFSKDPRIHGILVFFPLPKHLDAVRIASAIAPEKDIDCATKNNLYRAIAGEDCAFSPCTAEAVFRILDYYQCDLQGKETVVIGRSNVIGKPAAMMALRRNATVTICHTRTVNTAEVCRRAEVLVAAAGVCEMVDASYIKPGAIVVDVGIHSTDSGLKGDVARASVEGIAAGITPVPGGVGTVTSWILLEHVVRACERICKGEEQQ